MTPTHTASPRSSNMSLALIPKPDKFEIAREPARTSETLPVEDQRQSEPRAVTSIANFHDLPGSWKRGGINE